MTESRARRVATAPAGGVNSPIGPPTPRRRGERVTRRRLVQHAGAVGLGASVAHAVLRGRPGSALQEAAPKTDVSSPATPLSVEGRKIVMQPEGGRLEMEILDVQVGSVEAEGYRTITLATSRGDVECRHYPVLNATRAALWVPGAISGWHTPAGNLYPRLSREFLAEGIASLQVLYRQAAVLGECVLDVLAGLAYLEGEGIEAISLTGHSFGGAVVIQAGAASALTRAVVTLSTQGAGAEAVTRLPDDCAILLVHGTADEILPPAGSERVHARAHAPKRLVLYPDANHNLDQVAAEVHDLVRDWILQELDASAEAATPTA